ncbi:MAG: hypothetical protein C4296_09380 [Gemmataceae bacterium]
MGAQNNAHDPHGSRNRHAQKELGMHGTPQWRVAARDWLRTTRGWPFVRLGSNRCGGIYAF